MTVFNSWISLENFVENLLENKFKCLLQEYSEKELELVKQKNHCPYEYMISFEGFDETNLPYKKASLVH